MNGKIFYGWIMLFGMFLMYSATNGIGMYAFGVLRKMQAASFGLDAQSQAALPSVLFLVVAMVSPIVGWMLDKYDTKKLISIGAILVAVLVFAHKYVTNYKGLLFFYGLFAVGMSLAGIISFMYLINKWFRKNVGLAAGFLLIGSSFGGIVFPKIAAAAGDWQTASVWLGAVGAIFLIVPLFLIKNTPAEMGLTPDGLPVSTKNMEARHPDFIGTEGGESTNVGITLAEALKTPSFYLVLLVTGTLWFCINGYIQNHAFFMTDLGKNAAETATVLGTFSMMAIIGKLLFGWLSDKYQRSYIMVLSIGIMVISILILKMCQANPSVLMPFALVFGIGFGGAFSIIQIWVADIYAGKNFGSILGVVTMIDTIAGSVGMILLGSMRKASGSFDSGFNLMLGLCLLALASTFFVKKQVL
jgi:MFS transporter, OFA family, oxalate/formate antiporter